MLLLSALASIEIEKENSMLRGHNRTVVCNRSFGDEINLWIVQSDPCVALGRILLLIDTIGATCRTDNDSVRIRCLSASYPVLD